MSNTPKATTHVKNALESRWSIFVFWFSKQDQNHVAQLIIASKARRKVFAIGNIYSKLWKAQELQDQPGI